MVGKGKAAGGEGREGTVISPRLAPVSRLPHNLPLTHWQWIGQDRIVTAHMT